MDYKELADKIEQLEKKYDNKFIDIFKALRELLQHKEDHENFENRERIGYKPHTS